MSINFASSNSAVSLCVSAPLQLCLAREPEKPGPKRRHAKVAGAAPQHHDLWHFVVQSCSSLTTSLTVAAVVHLPANIHAYQEYYSRAAKC